MDTFFISSLVMLSFRSFSPPQCFSPLSSICEKQDRVLAALDYVTRKLQAGDWRLLHILEMNMEPLVFGELVVELAMQLLIELFCTKSKVAVCANIFQN